MKHESLRIAFVELKNVLSGTNGSNWLRWVNDCIGKIDSGAIDRRSVRSVFGGMGSFNDLVLTYKDSNGGIVMDQERNIRVDELKNIIWKYSENI